MAEPASRSVCTGALRMVWQARNLQRRCLPSGPSRERTHGFMPNGWSAWHSIETGRSRPGIEGMGIAQEVLWETTMIDDVPHSLPLSACAATAADARPVNNVSR